MPKRTVVVFAAAAFIGGALPTQTAQARDNDDDIWDLMDPSWWADEIFDDDDDDDDWWYYQQYRYSPYWGGPYSQYPRVIVILPQPETTDQNPETRLPE
jgi:hypothetical protein